MSRVALRQIIGRQPEARLLVATIAEALGAVVTVEDTDGRLLHGDVCDATPRPRTPIMDGDRCIGWVSAAERGSTIAALLTHLTAREAERKALGSEVLHLYREINLIYSFSEKLTALLDVERVAELTIGEARHLIVATDGIIALGSDDSSDFTVVASFGDELSTVQSFSAGEGIIGAVAASGIGEIVNDVAQDPRRMRSTTPIGALIAAPLKVGERVIGLIALGSTERMEYTAAELKLLNTLALQTATAIENARLFERTVQAAQDRERLQALHQATELARARLDSELTLAARIQADLFPTTLPAIEGYELAARNRPARRCGGDYYDVIRMRPANGAEPMLFCVADVAGKGLPAALVMSNMQATLRALLGRTSDLPALAAEASALLFGSTAPEKYVTAALAALDPATGAVIFLGAGHLDNLVVRHDGSMRRLSSTGPPLGLLPIDLPFEQSNDALAPGDCLVLFSDGITDAQNNDSEEFGEARLQDILGSAAGETPEAIIDRVFAAVDAFVEGAPQFDDMTILIAGRR